ncbi:hypothetical protein U1Q18_007437, partial [Sarracenia purpurea var. burkii]
VRLCLLLAVVWLELPYCGGSCFFRIMHSLSVLDLELDAIYRPSAAAGFAKLAPIVLVLVSDAVGCWKGDILGLLRC